MSVPLDRLYDFINDSTNHDAVIYRWMPHGSKKITDLSALGWQADLDWHLQLFQRPVIVCHDQEYLNPELHNLEQFTNAFVERSGWGDLPMDFNSKFINFKALYGFQAWCPSIYPLILLHSEKNSPALDFYQTNMNMIDSYYWCHGLLARDWYRYARLDPRLHSLSPFDAFSKDFLIYARAWAGSREYRLKFLDILVQKNLHQVSSIKFNPSDSNLHYTQHDFRNVVFRPNIDHLEKYTLPNTASSDASAVYDTGDYKQCACEIVLETVFDDQRWHLTEKILRPIACGKPFLLVSTPGALKYLRSYGFDTFGDIIDESYDEIVDPIDRLNAIAELMHDLSTATPGTKCRIWRDMHKVARRNQKRFFSDGFFQLLTTELYSNLRSALDKAKSTPNIGPIKRIIDAYDRTHDTRHPANDHVYIQAMRRCLS